MACYILASPGETVEIHYMNEVSRSTDAPARHPAAGRCERRLPAREPYLADTVLVAPGERYTVLVKPTEAEKGVWAYHCHILSHAEKSDGMMFGMVTAFIVQ